MDNHRKQHVFRTSRRYAADQRRTPFHFRTEGRIVRKKSLAVLLTFTLLASPALLAQAASSNVEVAEGKISQKDSARLKRVKRTAVRISKDSFVRVELTDRSRIRGFLKDVSDQGITVRPWTQQSASTSPQASQFIPDRLIQFDRIRKIARTNYPDEGLVAFGAGIPYGLLGPLGWLGCWLLVTGRAED